MSRKSLRFEYVKDPLYGYISLYEHEKELIETSVFQRLRRLKQLPTAQLVYPGATHNRFSHSLGVMHLAGMFTEKLLEPYLRKRKLSFGEYVGYVLLMRLWGLTHDIGHGPFGHIFDQTILQHYGLDHERMGAEILKQHPEMINYFGKIRKNIGIELNDLIKFITTQDEEAKYGRSIARTDLDEGILLWILKGVYSADSMDFTLRDSQFTGAGYGNFDWQRLILSSKIHNGSIVLDRKANEALDSFLLARLFMFATVYYHRTARFFDRICERMLVRKRKFFLPFIKDVVKYCQLDEETILNDKNFKDMEEVKILINRKVTHSMVKDRPLSFKEEETKDKVLLGMLGGLEGTMKSKLKEIPKDSFIIDVPFVRVNPMRYGKFVHIWDSRTDKVERRSVLETSWGDPMPYRVTLVRLYVRKDLPFTIKKRIEKTFDSLIKAEKEKDVTYY